jgi:hypothetical protein
MAGGNVSAPRRLVDDPDADVQLRRLLDESAGARPLDATTRRRIGSKVARVAAVPALAAGWVLFVKSAAAALGAVGVAATVATVTGAIEWPERREPRTPVPSPVLRAPSSKGLVSAPQTVAEAPLQEPSAPPTLNPVPSLPQAPPLVPSGASLSAESTLLEQARREVRRAPAIALQIVGEHAQRFPRGQLASERTLIEVEALLRLGHREQAQVRARALLRGASGNLYAERVRQLLGEGSVE